jgi:hypothetical protein
MCHQAAAELATVKAERAQWEQHAREVTEALNPVAEARDRETLRANRAEAERDRLQQENERWSRCDMLQCPYEAKLTACRALAEEWEARSAKSVEVGYYANNGRADAFEECAKQLREAIDGTMKE